MFGAEEKKRNASRQVYISRDTCAGAGQSIPELSIPELHLPLSWAFTTTLATLIAVSGLNPYKNHTTATLRRRLQRFLLQRRRYGGDTNNNTKWPWHHPCRRSVVRYKMNCIVGNSRNIVGNQANKANQISAQYHSPLAPSNGYPATAIEHYLNCTMPVCSLSPQSAAIAYLSCQAWTRFVRFLSEDGKEYGGEPEDASIDSKPPALIVSSLPSSSN